MTIGFFGGSFNPPHTGHIALAKAVAEAGLVDEVWLVLSPQNPFKTECRDMAPDRQRMDMLRLAAEGEPLLRACDVELTMPRPNYTVETLRRLSAEHPGDRFRLIMGQDNWRAFDRWREHDTLLRDYAPIVYMRADATGVPPGDIRGVDTLPDAPLLPVSSTEIRDRIARGEDVNNLVPPRVYKYIVDNRLYGYGGKSE